MSEQELISAPEEVLSAASQILSRETVQLFKSRTGNPDEVAKSILADVLTPVTYKLKKSDLVLLSKAAENKTESNVGRLEVMRPHPFNFKKTAELQQTNEHHATCLHAKVESTIGIGFKNPEVAKVLNKLCKVTWQHVIRPVVEDYHTLGNGFLEVVRNKANEIVGLFHLQPESVFIYVEDSRNYHFVIQNIEEGKGDQHFPVFGDKEDFLKRVKKGAFAESTLVNSDKSEHISEVIHFSRMTSLDPFYGMPDWISAIAAIEIASALKQFKYDFFQNRGVPEFMLFITGQRLTPDDWKKVEKALNAQIGLGNSHKSLALNLTSSDIKIQLEKLGIEANTEEAFPQMADALAMQIVTAHGVPPLLGNILIPGKLGATNEFPNALQTFQLLKIGPSQHTFEQIFGCTLGDSEKGIKGLNENSFELKKITDEIDLGQADTVSRMRETVAEASANGRDLSAGLKD